MYAHAQSKLDRRNGSPSRFAASLPNGVHADSAPNDEPLTFEALFRTYHAKLCAFALRYVRSTDVAEEVVEDVYLRLWAQRPIWETSANQRRYLYAAVRNQALKHLAHERVVRKSHAVVQGDGIAPAMSQPPAGAEDEVQAAELAAAFQRVVDRLPARCREAYHLHCRDGMSYAEIADLMNISARTVETQVARAKKFLRRALAVWLS
jgi:RNA polymerase sigma-70 factor (ECF subfamily)